MTVAVMLAEPDVAVIVAVPSPTEGTTPADDTVATAVFDDDQVTAAPDITVPSRSLTVGVSVAVSANDANERLVGDNVTLEATCDTVTVAVALAVALAEPDVAVIVTVPFATAVTSPEVET